MDENDFTSRDFDLLKILVRYVNSRGENILPPDNQWLAKQLNVTSSAISNLKKRLKKKGYLVGESSSAMSLTDKAFQTLESIRFVLPTQIPIRGEVKAGRTKQDEIVVDMRNLDDFDDTLETITIPYIDDTSEIFGLKVIGQSMEKENIHDGDYIIVQRFGDSEKPKQGELIVTQYLSEDDEQHVDLEYLAAGGDVPGEYLEGPTVKYFYQKNGMVRLSQRKDTATSEYTIRTRFPYPIGRVIGIYRPVR